MTTVTQVELACDICGDTNDVKTRAFALDGQAYAIDLCRKDGDALGRVAATYMAKARTVTAGRRSGQRRGRPRKKAKPRRSQPRKGIAEG